MALYYSPEDIPSWSASEVTQLPTSEDEGHEYKSSLTAPETLKQKIGIAASGFWNTGGGVFVGGVNDEGRPDGGLPLMIGRQSLRDWTDKCLERVSPIGSYRVAVIEDPALQLKASCGILVIAFGESHIAPHMAPNNQYYMRVGAHTVPAPHFIVESLFARRGLSQPLLRTVLRSKPTLNTVLQLGIIAASSAPALDVRIDLSKATEDYFITRHGRTQLTFGVISADAPSYTDIHWFVGGIRVADMPPFSAELNYRDVGGREYSETVEINPQSQLGLSLQDDSDTRKIIDHLKSMESSLKSIASRPDPEARKVIQHLKSMESSLKNIASSASKIK